MKQPLLLSICLLSFFVARSQTGFELKDLQLPDVERYVFQINLTTNQSNAANRNQISSARSSFSLQFNPRYSGYKNYRYRQSFTSGDFQLAPSYQRSSNDVNADSNYQETNGVFRTGLNFSTDQFYYNENYRFIGYSVAFSGSFDGSENNRPGESRREASDYMVSLAPGIHFGKGRLDPINQGHMAFFMLKDLQRDIAFAKPATTDDFVALANEIARLQRVRNFDARWRRIYQAEQLDSFFMARGLIADCSARFYTRVYDNFFFAQGASRFNGKRTIVRITPSFYHNYEWDKHGTKVSNETIAGLSGEVSLTKEVYKQLSNYTQRYSSAGLYFRNVRERNRNWSNWYGDPRQRMDTVRTSFVGVLLQRGYDFYPSTRTNFHVAGELDAYISGTNLDDLSGVLVPQITTSGYYYISPATRISGSFRVMYAMDEVGSVPLSDNVFTLFQLSFLHNIF